MKTFVELVEEIKKGFDKEDNSVLSNLEDNIELTSTATVPHAVDTYLVYNKTIYRVTAAIQTGDTLTPGTNITVASDIMALIASLGADLVNVEECIAPVESTTTASRAYAIGERFIKNHTFYKAKTSIAYGDTLVLNTNYEAADDVSSEIQTLTNNLSDEVETRAKLGAHQLIPFDLASMKASNTSGTWNGNSYTRDGITYTVELDNYGNVIGFDVDGTGHGSPFIICPSTQITRLLNRTLIMSCNASPDLSFMVYHYYGTNNLYCNGDDVDVTLTSDAAHLQLYVRSSSDKTFSHFKIYPLLRTKDDLSREFTPYAKTNQELTAENQTLTNEVRGNWATGGVNLVNETIAKSNITSNGTIQVTENPNYDVCVAPIKQGVTYYPTTGNTGSEGFMYAFFSSKPERGSTSYDSTRYLTAPQAFTAPINGYIAFRVAAGYATAQLEVGDHATPYQPYAKTNKELTADVDVLIENGAVNKLPNNATTQTITGIQITVNADKSMTISGNGNSATVDIFNDANNPILISEDCKFSCGATFTSSTCEIVATATDNTTYSLKLSTGNSITIPAGKSIKRVYWYNNNVFNETLTIYPMIADADYSGGYVPYAKTNLQLTEENQTLTNEVDTIVNDVSAKNILPFDLAYAKKINTTGTWNNNAYSITGVTFTVNDDNTVTVNGTATADTYFRVYYDTDLTGMLVASKKYILSGCPSEVSSGVGALYINGIPNIISIDGSEAEFTYDTSVNRTTISILVHNGATITNKVFEPMIRPASIKDSTYVPYAMTNRELTEKVSPFAYSNVKGVDFQVTGNRLLISLYTDDAKSNGLRIDFNGNDNVIQLNTITNGTMEGHNRVSFPVIT